MKAPEVPAVEGRENPSENGHRDFSDDLAGRWLVATDVTKVEPTEALPDRTDVGPRARENTGPGSVLALQTGYLSWGRKARFHF